MSSVVGADIDADSAWRKAKVHREGSGAVGGLKSSGCQAKLKNIQYHT
jgi:hypothetical protein